MNTTKKSVSTVEVPRRTLFGATLAAAAAGTLGACDFGGTEADDPDGDGGASGSGGTLREMMRPVTHLDPAILSGASFAQILMQGLMEGLVSFDENGTDVVPGVAESWDISEDQLTYTFHLRDDALWSNGDPVTASDFEWNWQRTLTPGIAGEDNPSYPGLGLSVSGAAAYMNGETDDFSTVGVTAIDESTLEIVLDLADPSFLLTLAQWWALPLHPPTIEEVGDDWLDPAVWVSNGPYILDHFEVNQGATLIPNDQYWDKDSYHIGRWEVTFNDGGASVAVLSYQNDEIDVANIGSGVETAESDPELADAIRQGPLTICHTLALMISHDSPLQDVRIRRALSISIDREQLAEVAGRSVARNLVPSAVADADDIPPIEYDPEAARQLLTEAGFPNGDGLPTISLLTYQSSAIDLEAVVEMWQDELGLDAVLDSVESGVYSEKRSEIHPSDYVGFYRGSYAVTPPTMHKAVNTGVAGIGDEIQVRALPAPTAEEYFSMQEGGASQEDLDAFLDANLYPEFQEFVTLAAEANAETNPDRQAELLTEAAIAREESHIVIPLTWGGYTFLVRPTVQNLNMLGDFSVFSTRNVTIEQ